VGLSVALLGEKSERVEDPYARWKKRSLNLLSMQRESTIKEWNKTGDKEKRRGNTVVESRCYLDLCCDKTEEKSFGKLFKLVSFDRELSRELNDI
jgi:hypothetical protein